MPDYFTLVELRALPDVWDEAKYPDERVEAAAAHIVAIIEREVGTSFVERTVTAELHDGGEYEIALDSPYVRSVTSATENGVAVTDTLLADKGGVLIRLASPTAGTKIRWARGIRNVSVTYEAGYSDTPPADVKEQALKATRTHLMASSSTNWSSDRQTSISTDMGVVSYVVAGVDRPSGYPELDAVIAGYKARLDVQGFA